MPSSGTPTRLDEAKSLPPRVGASLDEARVLMGGRSDAGADERHPYLFVHFEHFVAN
ncbi:MAG: hypothetical protein SynsKO_18110 [Synoicihabitans sp.]